MADGDQLTNGGSSAHETTGPAISAGDNHEEAPRERAVNVGISELSWGGWRTWPLDERTVHALIAAFQAERVSTDDIVEELSHELQNGKG